MQDHASPMPLSPTPPSGDHKHSSRISRRRFGQQAALAATAVLAPAPSFSAAHDFGGKATNDSGLAPEQSQEVEARLANIVRKYGDRLTQEQRHHLRRILTYNEKMLASVRAFPLQNGDSPADVLKVSRSAKTLPPATRLSATEEGKH